MDLREVGCDPRDWIALAEDRDQWRTYVERLVIQFLTMTIVIGFDFFSPSHSIIL